MLTKIILFNLCIISLQLEGQVSKMGSIIVRSKFFDTAQNDYKYLAGSSSDINIIYNDSFIIFHNYGIGIEEANGIETRKLIDMGYTYCDLRKLVFYDYDNFSDTAKIIRKYNQNSDSLQYFKFWKFYESYEVKTNLPIQRINDTSINDKNYMRYLIENSNYYKNKNVTDTIIVYASCEKKGTYFQFFKPLSERIGCPIVKTESINGYVKHGSHSSEIEFIRDYLTNEERKIFSTWQKNSEEHPIDNW